MSQEEIRQQAAQLQQEQIENPVDWDQAKEANLQMLVALDLQIQWQARKEAV